MAIDYHTCRGCVHFVQGNCCDGLTCDDLALDPFWEDGVLRGAIEESFPEFKAPQMEQFLNGLRLSGENRSRLLYLLQCDFEDWSRNAAERLDEGVSAAMSNYDFGDPEVVIDNPATFHCAHWA